MSAWLDSVQFVPIHALDARAAPSALEQTAAMLEAQWPKLGHAERLTRSSDSLPSHFILMNPADGEVIAHASLHASAEVGEGLTVIAQNVLVSPLHRRKGVGQRLLQHLEEYAVLKGAGYIRLSTADQQAFYRACGYAESEPGNTDSAAVRKIDGTALNALQAMLMRRNGVGGGAGGSGSGADSVTWFRKRLRGFSSSVRNITAIEVGDAVQAALQAHNEHDSSTAAVDSERVLLCAQLLPWRRQVGPSCGLTALLMACHGLLQAIQTTSPASDADSSGSSSTDTRSVMSIKLVSPAASTLQEAAACSRAQSVLSALVSDPEPLLQLALHRRLSADGEIFALNSMVALCKAAGEAADGASCLAADICRFDGLTAEAARLHSGAAATASAADAALPLPLATISQQICDMIDAGALLLVPYDVDARATGAPCCAGGTKAHWGVIVGYVNGTAPPPSQPGDVLVLLQHSMSPQPVCCWLSALLASNAQLHGADPHRALKSGWVLGDSATGSDDQQRLQAIELKGGAVMLRLA